MKKSTLIVLALAIVAGVAFYHFDWKKGEKDAARPAADDSKPAFTFKADDVASITITRSGDPATPQITLAKQSGGWQIAKPLATLADDATASGLAQALANARIEGTQPGSPDRLKVYGLDPAAFDIDFQLQNGTKHSIQLGKKDFVGTSVYAKLDQNSDVSLLPESLLGFASKNVEDLRDRSILHARNDQITAFDLKNPSGEIVATKVGHEWKLTKPSAVLADTSAVEELLGAATGGKMVSVGSESPDNLAKYGLATPSITFTVTDAKGKSAMLIVGKKDAEGYFAREESLPTIFRISDDLQKKLAEKFNDLRDKKIVHFDPATITQVDVHNASGAFSLTRKNQDEWTFDAPPELKGKPGSPDQLFSRLDQARADEIVDAPGTAINPKLAKPSFEAVLMSKDGTKLTIDVSQAQDADGSVYARTSQSPAAYKLKKQLLDDLNIKATDLAF
jgi:Domain of unknown function (DUF4340)